MISKDKTYRTRDGREVRIYATDGAFEFPIQGAIKNPEGWASFLWTAQGRCSLLSITDGDLIEVKPRIKQEYWLNIYPKVTETRCVFGDKKFADEGAKSGRIACVKIVIDCEEGEGL